MYQQVPVSLTKAQFDKLRRGHQIQLSHKQIAGSGLKNGIAVHPETAKKIHNARMKQKGCRISMTPHELECSGEGLKEFLEGLRNAGKWIKEKVIDTPFYQENIRPIARQLVNQGVQMAATKVGPQGQMVAQKAVDVLGQQTGAFGIKQKKKVRKTIHENVMDPSVMSQGHVVDNAYVWPQPIPDLVNWGVGAKPKRKQVKRAKGFKPA
jgi:hypothetical protein